MKQIFDILICEAKLPGASGTLAFLHHVYFAFLWNQFGVSLPGFVKEKKTARV